MTGQAFISGIGRTKFGELVETLPELAYRALASAVSDAGIEATALSAAYVSNFIGGPAQRQLHLAALVASLLPKNDIPIVRIENACASGGVALHQAIRDVRLGVHSAVAVIGVEKMT